MELFKKLQEIVKETDKNNANIGNSPASKMYQIGSEASKEFYLERTIPKEYSVAHRKGYIHIHDMDYHSITVNCFHIPLNKILKDGFYTIRKNFIRRPKRPESATALAAIIMQSCQNSFYGGQSFPKWDSDLEEFMIGFSEREIYQAMESFIFNMNSMHSRAGNQICFSSLNLGLNTSPVGRLIIKNTLLAYEAGGGKGENFIFPNIIFKVKKGINYYPTDPNYDLYKLALRVASKRMNPTFLFCDAPFNKAHGDEMATMGCRTRVIDDRFGEAVTAGRGNITFTTINLPRIAIESEKSMTEFHRRLDFMMDLVAEQLKHRYDIVSNLKVKDIPFVMDQGLYIGSEKLTLEDTIEPAIKHGTLGIGFIGLAEALTSLIDCHHGETDFAQKLGLDIIEHMYLRTKSYGDEYNLNFSLFATPAEGLCERFLKIDRNEFGFIKGVTDKDYYTNSFHIPVKFKIPFDRKIELEAPYHAFSPGGHICYVELTAPPVNNIFAMDIIVKKMAEEGIGYGAINFPIDECQGCGYIGVITTPVCPNCGGTRIRSLRRVCGYLSNLENFNDGKKAEVRDRKSHFHEGKMIRWEE